jgi:ribonuclease HI
VYVRFHILSDPSHLTLVDKRFASYTEAESFMRSDGAAAAARPKPSQQKWYGVQVGHNPGVYTDYEEVKRQIRGYAGSKQQRFATREEAQAFVDAEQGGTPAYTNVTSTAPSVKDDLVSEPSTLRKTPKTADNPPKKQKRHDALPIVYLENGEIDPGTGPLPPDAEDGFDRNIILRPDTGRIEFKTEAELNARKWQATGETTDPLVIHTDGAAPGNGQDGAVAGIGVYFGPRNPKCVIPYLASHSG